jgi:hypothetical protein
MTDYSEQGAIPVEDAASADPPTVDEVLERQRIEHPEQVRPRPDEEATAEERATEEAGGQVVAGEPGAAHEIEGPNSA